MIGVEGEERAPSEDDAGLARRRGRSRGWRDGSLAGEMGLTTKGAAEGFVAVGVGVEGRLFVRSAGALETTSGFEGRIEFFGPQREIGLDGVAVLVSDCVFGIEQRGDPCQLLGESISLLVALQRGGVGELLQWHFAWKERMEKTDKTHAIGPGFAEVPRHSRQHVWHVRL